MSSMHWIGLSRWLVVQNPPAVQETHRRYGFNPWVRKIPLEEKMATHSSILSWEIRLQSMELHRVWHDWSTKKQDQCAPNTHVHRRKMIKLTNLFCLLVQFFFFFFTISIVANPSCVFLQHSEKTHMALATFFSHHFPSSSSALS